MSNVFLSSLNFVVISTHSNQTFYITKENAKQLEATVVCLERTIESQHVEVRESISYWETRCNHEEGENNGDSVSDSGGLPSWINKEAKTMREAGF